MDSVGVRCCAAFKAGVAVGGTLTERMCVDIHQKGQ